MYKASGSNNKRKTGPISRKQSVAPLASVMQNNLDGIIDRTRSLINGILNIDYRRCR